jgi:hypothetical protein
MVWGRKNKAKKLAEEQARRDAEEQEKIAEEEQSQLRLQLKLEADEKARLDQEKRLEQDAKVRLEKQAQEEKKTHDTKRFLVSLPHPPTQIRVGCCVVWVSSIAEWGYPHTPKMFPCLSMKWCPPVPRHVT